MTLVLFVAYAHIKPLHVFGPVFVWVAQGMSNVNELLDWALVPLVVVLKVIFKALFFVIRPLAGLLPKHDHAAHHEAMLAAGWSPAEGDHPKGEAAIEEP
jgi:hypothetical protein